ncbi:conserved Plasmodium protein, unknown function [Plasmodium berghei]|uniref:Uncharacterized protein n=2 Tax=Plasmodium berghei TaxID=5821 RepID=A0A509AK06_PLABA|nr:conserved Plasmodium protein, unknown function [Plasmodium berghei ANKA]SCM20553.1 conserved Plasmodium protein, unknown function [Plasmodium berghei]SCN24129.1 conserved Plasmodium protein, unknown function [Plasmodium berghei]SCO60619.1 conserved Plasmodium protein, unknown function [Plasmodium berghei]VUC55126.1 conserved Plasmodium protein, unknown function [Plasmodium berghei ANKA]|eukprot:XP_034420945.1 conserved Plasmodium protein, unknown function [Plasmodium berghei ANKA]
MGLDAEKNKFDLIDVEPKSIEFYYDSIESFEEFVEKKKKVIEKKVIKIKNICTKIQNIKIFESESKYLKIKGIKKKKLAPGTYEKILVEFSFCDININKYKYEKIKNILDIINNIEGTINVKVQSEYTTLYIPIYIKKKVPIFKFNNIFNLGLCKTNLIYDVKLEIKNVGNKKGTLCLDNINNEMVENDGNKNSNTISNGNNKHIVENNLFIYFDKSTICLNPNETGTINIKIKNKNEEKIQKTYKIITQEYSYFSQTPKNLTIIAFFINSQVSFIYDNMKTNQINLNYIYFGNSKRINGQIKNENQYPVICKLKKTEVKMFYDSKEFASHAVDRGVDVRTLLMDLDNFPEFDINNDEKKKSEENILDVGNNLKIEEKIKIKLEKQNDIYFIDKQSCTDILLYIEIESCVDILNKIDKNYSYMLNYPVMAEITITANKCDEKIVEKYKGITNKKKTTIEPRKNEKVGKVRKNEKNEKISNKACNDDCEEDLKFYVFFCLTFPSIVSNMYFLNYDMVGQNEEKTLILELNNLNKFLKINYNFSKVSHIYLNKKEGVINPLSKDIISLNLKCNVIKNIDEYLYLFFCNKLYFFVFFVKAQIIKTTSIGRSIVIKNEKMIKQNNRNTIELEKFSISKIGDENLNEDIIYEQILKKLDLERIDKNLYSLDGKLDKYKYNEKFMSFLKENKKKYNDILKYMYNKRDEKKEKQGIKKPIPENERINNIINDKFIYISDKQIIKNANMFINKSIYDEKRKTYIDMKKRKEIKIFNIKKSNEKKEDIQLEYSDVLEENQIKNLIFDKIIYFNYVLFNQVYTKMFNVHNTNDECNIKINFIHSSNLNLDKNLLFIKGNSKEMVKTNLLLNLPIIKTEMENWSKTIDTNEIKYGNICNDEKKNFQLLTDHTFNPKEKNNLSLYETEEFSNNKKTYLFDHKYYTENIILKINDNYEDMIVVKGNIILLNIVIKINTLYFYFKNSDISMFCENNLILYNPFNIPIPITLEFSKNIFEAKNKLVINPSEYKTVPIKFIGTKNIEHMDNFINLYLDNNRLYKRIKCIFDINKCSCRINVNEIKFENIILNKKYFKHFYLTNTGDIPVVFNCVAKPDCVNIYYKYNYVNKNESVKIIVSIKLKENKQIKDKIILSIRGSDNIIIPIIVTKVYSSNLLFLNDIKIDQETNELKRYEINIVNKGGCEENVILNLSEFNFLNIELNKKTEKNRIIYNNKEYKNVRDMKDDFMILKKIFKTEYENVITNKCVKYYFNKLIDLYNFLHNFSKNKFKIIFVENKNKDIKINEKNMYKIKISPKCFVSLYIQCYYNNIIKKEIKFNKILFENKCLHELSNEVININIQNSQLSISPNLLFFQNIIPYNSERAFITYYKKEAIKKIKLKNNYSYPIKWRILLYDKKQKDNLLEALVHNFVEIERKQIMKNNEDSNEKIEINKALPRPIQKKDVNINSKKGCIQENVGNKSNERIEKMYEIEMSEESGIIKANEEIEVEVKLKNCKDIGKFVDILELKTSVVKNEQADKIFDEKKYCIYILSVFEIPKLYFDITYINIIYNKLNDTFTFPFKIYNYGYSYVRINYKFENLYTDFFFLSLDFIQGNEIDIKTKKINVELKCKSIKNLKFKSEIIISILDYDIYKIPVFINIDENIDYFLEKVEYEKFDPLTSQVNNSNFNGYMCKENSRSKLSEIIDEVVWTDKRFNSDTIVNDNKIENDKINCATDCSYNEIKEMDKNKANNYFKNVNDNYHISNVSEQNNELLSFYCKNICIENCNIFKKKCIYKNLKINNIRNVYYNKENEFIEINEIPKDYVFVFLQNILLNKSCSPTFLENTNDLFLFFINLLIIFFHIYPNRNIYNLLHEIKIYQNISMQNFEKNIFIHENILANIKQILKSLKEEKLLVNHIIYENLLPIDLYCCHILDKVPDNFYIKNVKYKRDSFEIKDIYNFINNNDDKILYFDRILKTHLKVFSYSWITIFFELLNKEIFNCVNIESLYKLRGIKLCNIENKVHENIKIQKINFLVILNKENNELNKHTSMLENIRNKTKREKINGDHNINDGNKNIKFAQINEEKKGKKINKKINNIKNGVIKIRKQPTTIKKMGTKKKDLDLNYFNFYENNLIDLKYLVNKINNLDLWSDKGGDQKEKENKMMLEKCQNKKKDTHKKENQIVSTNQTNISKYYKNVEYILFEWLYFHYNNVYYNKVKNEQYIFKNKENEYAKNESNSIDDNNCNSNKLNDMQKNDDNSSEYMNNESSYKNLDKSNFYREENKKKYIVSENKLKITNIYSLKNLVIILYTIISHIPYFLFFKNKIKVECKNKKDYMHNIDILLVILNEIKLSNLITRQVLIDFNYIHIFLFLNCLYFILPNYLPKYYLDVDDIQSYKSDRILIKEEIVKKKNTKKHKKNADLHKDNEGKRNLKNNNDKSIDQNERIILIYNLNNNKCRYTVFLIGCSKYEIDKEYIEIDSHKSEEIKLKIDPNYDKAILKYDYNINIKFPSFTKKINDIHKKDNLLSHENINNIIPYQKNTSNFGDYPSISSYSIDSFQSSSSYDGIQNVEENNNYENNFCHNENYTILVLRKESNFFPGDNDEEKFICIKLVETNKNELKSEIVRNNSNLLVEGKEWNKLNSNLKFEEGKVNMKSANGANSSKINIMLKNSEIKCFNMRGKIYENKSVEINLINDISKKVDINMNMYHIYVKNLRSEEIKKGNFSIDILNNKNKENINYKNKSNINRNINEEKSYNQCDVCSLLNFNLKKNLNCDKDYFSCFYIENMKPFVSKENEKRTITLHFCPFIEGYYLCFLLFCAKDIKTKCVISSCKLNCLFYINNIKEEEVIKINSQLSKFSYQIKLTPINKRFLKCIQFILCYLNKMGNNVFLNYLKSYLNYINKINDKFYIMCDKAGKTGIKEKLGSFQKCNYNDFLNKMNENDLCLDNFYDEIKEKNNYLYEFNINEEIMGVYEYNIVLMTNKEIKYNEDVNNSIQPFGYDKLEISEINENSAYNSCNKLYKIIASINKKENNNIMNVTFNQNAYLLSKKYVSIYNYTNNNLIYKCSSSEVLDMNKNKIDYKIFHYDEYIEIDKDVESFNFEIRCYSIVEVTCSCFIILTNVQNEKDVIKINVKANIMKPYPKDTIHLKILNKMKKAVSIEIYNELDFHCEYKIYSDLSIIFGDQKIEMLPKQKKVYTFFVRSIHIGEFIGCIIFKCFRILDENNIKDSRYMIENDSNITSKKFSLVNSFFWYKLKVTVDLNKPINVLMLESNIGDVLNKEIVLKNNGNKKEEYFLLLYMNEYIEKKKIEISAKDAYVYTIRYAPKIPNYFDNIVKCENEEDTKYVNFGLNEEKEKASKYNKTKKTECMGKDEVEQNESIEFADISNELSNFYFLQNEEEEIKNEGDCLQRNMTKRLNLEKNEKKIFEELIKYCEKYINVDIKYTSHNIGFFFIYNKNEGVSYYILILLARFRTQLDISSFSSLLSKSCLIHLNFEFSNKNKRYVNKLETYQTNTSYYYKIGEYIEESNINIDDVKLNGIDKDRSYNCIEKYNLNSEIEFYNNKIETNDLDKFSNIPDFEKMNNNENKSVDVKTPKNIRHNIKGIYLSNKINYSMINCDNKTAGSYILIKYKPTVGTSQECYIIIRSEIFGDFIYFLKGGYIEEKKIKERIVIHNSFCLYNFNINLFNPFSSKIYVKCMLKAVRSKNHMHNDGNEIKCLKMYKEARSKDIENEKELKEKVILNTKYKYFKLLSNENFKIKKRKHFSIFSTYFCKYAKSMEKLLILLYPIHNKRKENKSKQYIIYEYELFFNNTKSEFFPEKYRIIMDKKEEENNLDNIEHICSKQLNYISNEMSKCSSFGCNDIEDLGVVKKDSESEIAWIEDNLEQVESDGYSTIEVSSKTNNHILYLDKVSISDSSEVGIEECYEREVEMNNKFHKNGDAINNKEVVYSDGKIFIQSICMVKTSMNIFINKKNIGEMEKYYHTIKELEKKKQEKNIMHRNILLEKSNYKIFFLNLTNLKSSDKIEENCKDNYGNEVLNNILFNMNENILNNFLYINIIEDKESYLVISLELLADIPFHCNFFVMIKKVEIKEKNEDVLNVENDERYQYENDDKILKVKSIKSEKIKEFVTIEKNYIFLEIFNYINISKKCINIYIDNNLYSETNLNIFYKNNSDSYFDAYIVGYNQLRDKTNSDGIHNYSIIPKQGILKYNSFNKFMITRTNKINIMAFNSSFLLLIKTENNIFSYIISSHFTPSHELYTENEKNIIRDILKANRTKFSIFFNEFKQEKRESRIFNKKDEIIIYDISESNEIQSG